MVNFNYEIIRSRRKSISIIIQRNGGVLVKAPSFVPKFLIDQFVKTKINWIEKRRELVLQNLKEQKQFKDGEKFFYLGKEYILELGSTFTSIEIKDERILFPLALAKRGQVALDKWYIKQANIEIKKLVEEYAKKMGTSYNEITFSDTRSQWGRCTVDNRLQFNWRLIMSPLLVVRYVVIHELAHTFEKKHSAKFWNIVRDANPSYKQQIKWLKTHGHGLIA